MSDSVRNRSIRFAVWTSLLSKGGTALLQLAALPLAMRVMGWEQFGLYASVAAVLFSFQIFEVGLGPALTHGMSSAVAAGDRERECALSATGFYLLVGLAAVVAGVMAWVIWVVPVEWMFGAMFGPHAAELRMALWVGLGLMVVLMVLNHTDRVREGYMESWATNCWGAAGNTVAALAVAAGVWMVPTVWFLLLAVFGSTALAKGAHTVELWRARPWLVPSWRQFRGPLARCLLVDSLAYGVFAVGVTVVEFYVVQNLYGRVTGPVGVTGFAVLTTLTVAGLGFVLMVTTPTWPAVVDAKAKGEIIWIQRAARRLRVYALGFAGAAGLGLVAVGPWILPLWLGPKAAALDRPVLIAYALYFLLYVWRHVHHMLLVGMGEVRRLALVQSVESLLLLAGAVVAVRQAALAPLLLTMAAALALVTGWALPRMFHQSLRRSQSHPSPAPYDR